MVCLLLWLCLLIDPSKGFAFSPSGKNIAVASQDGYLRVFDCEDETYAVERSTWKN